MNRNALLAIHPGAMVGDDREDRIGPEGLLFGGIKEAAETVIRIFYGILALLLIRVFGNSSFGVSVRFVIGDGQDSREERLSGLIERAQFFNRAIENILVAHAPRGGESGFRIVTVERRIVLD